jgi:acyl transferase domain-containing protein/acyl carrier protein
MSENSPNADRRDLLKKALHALDEMQAKVRVLERARTEPIAIVGMGCRFPGDADSPTAYWQLLRDGVNAITEVPPGRWGRERYNALDPELAAKLPSPGGGFLSDVEGFDPAFFGISPREAVSMDPQQRLVLEVSWEALEHAGIDPSGLVGSATGVFVGVTAGDYWGHLRSADPTHLDVYIATGNSHNATAGRVAFTLGLQGPAMAVDTACSSSLAAVHLACQSLRLGESDLALAGGVNTMHSPDTFFAFFKWGMTAPDGRCKTFDDSADGFVRSEGCGMVVLKRLSDALSDGDRILALIRGSAVNQDGASSGFTVPNGLAQEAVIRQALRAAGVEPAAVSYVEAHGTGTSLGDPIELESLDAVLGQGRAPDRPLIVGSAKTNLGHLESAAGMAGLIKVVLSLQHGEIPPHLHFTTLNRRASFRGSPPIVPTRGMPWPIDGPRIAGVSSFGISGTNAHVIVEEAGATQAAQSAVDRTAHILTISARTPAALNDLVGRWQECVASGSVPSLADAAFTANTGRAHFAHRIALVAPSIDRVREQLSAVANGETPRGVFRGETRSDQRVKIAFLFTGQGAQYAGMGRRLYETAPVFRRVLDQCAELLRPELDRPLLSILYPAAGDEGLIDQTGYAQPALFAVEYALAELWRSWGVEPTLVLGHSVGEYVAACVAGVLSLEDGLRLIAARGRLMQALPGGGAMAAVWAGEAEVRTVTGRTGVEIAAVNGPASVTITGGEAAVAQACAALTAAGVRTQGLRVSHAFHSALMEPMLDAFTAVAETVRYAAPRVGVVSTVTGQRAVSGEVASAGYWRRQVREPVQFAAGMRTLAAQGCTVLVEVGPTPTLIGLGQAVLGAERGTWVPTLRREPEPWETLLAGVGTLYAGGVAVDWRGLDAPYARQKVALPTYPFQRQRFWIDAKPEQEMAALPVKPMERWPDWLYELEWQALDSLPARADQHHVPDPDAGRWLILADEGGVGRRLADLIAFRGGSCTVVVKGESYRSTDAPHRFVVNPQRREDFDLLVGAACGPNQRPCRGVIHLWSLDDPWSADLTASAIDTIQERACGSALYITQALASAGLPVLPSLTLVTRGVQDVAAAPASSPSGSPGAGMLWGLGRAVALEHPELRCTCVDLDPAVTDADLRSLYEMVAAGEKDENQIALRGGQSYALRLVRSPAVNVASAAATDVPLICRADRTYLVTGGLTGVGLRVAEHLVDRGARHLVLLGRRAPAAPALQAIASMQDRGALVTVVNADVADRAALDRLIDGVEWPLGGVVHSAGALDDGVLLQQNWKGFQTVAAAKVIGAWHLHELTRELPLDFFVLFSSTASLLGHPGQSNYAAANAFLDALAHYRRAQGLPAISINWGPWEGIGLAARTGLLDRTRGQGVTGIDPVGGMKALEFLLRAGTVQAAVLPVDWPTLIRSFPAGQQPALLRSFADSSRRAETTVRESAEPALLSQLAAAPPHMAWGVVLEYVTREACQVLGLDRAAGIDEQQGLRDLGLDSLMALELRNRLQHGVGRQLRATLALDCPSIDAIARHLATDALGVQPPARSSESNESGTDDVLMDIEQLSEDEVERMFASKVRGA